MHAKQEHWNYRNDISVWVGRYKNSHNILHWHHACELLYVESGSLDVYCNNRLYSIGTGDTFYIDSEQVHYMHAHTAETVIKLFVFNYDIIKDFAGGLELAEPLLAHDYRLSELYAELMRIITSGASFSGKEAICRMTMTMIDIYRHEQTLPKHVGKTSFTRFKMLLDDMNENYEFYDLERAANFMAMNPAYLSRLFHKIVGLTFSQYLNIMRCEIAVDLIKSGTDMSITQLANYCGFSTIRNFNRIFKELTGYTPRTLPKDFTMKEYYAARSDDGDDPTLDESILLESSDNKK